MHNFNEMIINILVRVPWVCDRWRISGDYTHRRRISFRWAVRYFDGLHPSLLCCALSGLVVFLKFHSPERAGYDGEGANDFPAPLLVLAGEPAMHCCYVACG